MKDMALWNEGDWIAAIAVVVLGAFLAGGAMIAASRNPEPLGHPKGLYMLFFAEMWERFSYYGMRAILIFYLVQHWLFSDGKSNLIYGAYTSLVYITPVLGGYLADRYLGQRKAVLFGGILIAFGHFFMVVEGDGGHDGQMSKQGLLDIYEMFGYIAIGVAVVVLLLSPIVKRWMHLDTLKDRDLEGESEVGEPAAAGIHPAAS